LWCAAWIRPERDATLNDLLEPALNAFAITFEDPSSANDTK